MNPSTHLKQTVLPLPIILLLACSVFLPKMQAVSPAPDGGYPGGNTAEGQNALLSRTTGDFNTAVGLLSLRSLMTGSLNTAVGAGTLLANTADENTASGAGALLSNTTGNRNMANGAFALVSNTEGYANTAVGDRALQSNTTGYSNTATGTNALISNISYENTATGYDALFSNTTGTDNTAMGTDALYLNTTGGENIALGNGAGYLTTGNNNIEIGNIGVTGESSTIRIGTTQGVTFIAGIWGSVVVSGAGVIIDSNGHLGTVVSSERFKDRIKPMDKASEAILALKPVTFQYKPELDPHGIAQFGLVAEDVEKVNPDLVVRDKEGKPYSVRYDQVNAMLLNEFLKEHRAFGEQQRTVAEQQKEIDALKAELKEQRSLIQKVGDRMEMNRSKPDVVANDL